MVNQVGAWCFGVAVGKPLWSYLTMLPGPSKECGNEVAAEL